MFEQGLRSLFYQIFKNAFRSLHGAFKAACLMFTVRAHTAVSDDSLDAGVTELIDYRVGLRVEEKVTLHLPPFSPRKKGQTFAFCKHVRIRMLLAEPPRSPQPLSQMPRKSKWKGFRIPGAHSACCFCFIWASG